MSRVVKLFEMDIDKESRDIREIKALLELGIEVLGVCHGENTMIEKSKYGYVKHIVRRRGIDKRQKVLGHSIWNWYSLIKTAKSLKPDCISCHNIRSLFAGWVVSLFTAKKYRPLLVYDSHEFEIKSNKIGNENFVNRNILPKLEKYLIKKAAFTIVPSESIANALDEIYGLSSKRPIVVRSTPEYWDIDMALCNTKKKEFYNALGIAEK